MKQKLLAIGIVVGSLAPAAQAMFEPVETDRVPIQRLLTNLDVQLNQPNVHPAVRAQKEFEIGRLHSMAFAQKTEEANIRKSLKNAPQPDPIEPFFNHAPDYYQFQVTDTKDSLLLDAAHKHLLLAILHLQTALQLEPNSINTKLGLAWCLDQNGNKQAALLAYHEIMQESWKSESISDSGPSFVGTSVYQEAAGYALKLLDADKDTQEITTLRARIKELAAKPRSITPIVVPLYAKGNLPIRLMQSANVSFDLDGTGPRRWSQWPGPQAGWLVYDAHNTKQITSGLQLFGQSTFWIFWKDGYEAMRSLDDNNDGRLSGTELNGLAIWCDINSDGKSDANEVKTVQDLGITSLSCMSTRSADGTIYSTNGVTFGNGQSSDTFDWIVPQVGR